VKSVRNKLKAETAKTHTHTRLTALCPGLPGWAGTRKVKPIWIGSGISWAICKSAPCSRQITTPAPHHSVFYRPDALPVTKPTVSKHWSTDSKIWKKYDHPLDLTLSWSTHWLLKGEWNAACPCLVLKFWRFRSYYIQLLIRLNVNIKLC